MGDVAEEETEEAGELGSLSEEQRIRRRRVIDVAFEIGAEGGYDAVQMREVATTANVALATIYRYFPSKDHLLVAAMTEWMARLQGRVVTSPPVGDTAVEQLTDVLHRACRALERQPKLSTALVRAVSSPNMDVRESGQAVQGHMAAMVDEILAPLDDEVRGDIVAVLSHVWYSVLVGWANGRREFTSVIGELDRAIRVLVAPYEEQVAAARSEAAEPASA